MGKAMVREVFGMVKGLLERRSEMGKAMLGVLVLGMVLALGTVALAGPIITLNHVAGDPVVIRHTGGYNQTHPAGLTMRRTTTTGTLYMGQTFNGGREIHKMDSSVTKLMSEANVGGLGGNDAGMGVIKSYTNQTFAGSVQSGAASQSGTANPSWNPTSDTVMLGASYYTYVRIDDVISQSASEAWGVTNEGVSVAGGGPGVTTGGCASRATTTSVARRPGHLKGGIAWADNATIGGTDYDRLFFAHGKAQTNNPAKWVRVLWIDDTITGWDAVTTGTRSTIQLHNASLADSLVLDETAYGALVDVATDEYIKDLAVYDGLLFILSYSSNEGDTYLSAVEYTMPTDGATAVSYTVADLDASGPKDYLVLDDVLSAAGVLNPEIAGGGIDFGAASGDTLMYVASTQGITYTFNVTGPAAPIPEPAGLGLVGLALLGVRKKRS